MSLIGPSDPDAPSSETGTPRDHAPAKAVDRPPLSRRRRRRACRRRIYRRIALVMVLPMAVFGYSYIRALTGPGSDSMSARSVEWMREHHLGGIVDMFERRWYQHHQAKVGGVPDSSIAQPNLATTAPTTIAPAVVQPPSTRSSPRPVNVPSAPTTSPSGPPTSSPVTVPAPRNPSVNVGALAQPAPLLTPAPTPFAHEGMWTPSGPVVRGTSGSAGAFGTLIRTDGVHTSVLDAVVWIDPRVLSLRHYPGAKVPGVPRDRPNYVEPNRQRQLVAAFEGGFRIADSHGGMILGGAELAPMRVGAATLAIDANGVPNIGVWGRDIDPSVTFDSARQNLDLIVDGGAAVSQMLQDPNRSWGFTGPANKSAVWRSGAGVTADGALVWIGGPGLTIQALADLLVRAGAIRGMQLDISHQWVLLNTYTIAADGSVVGTRILPGMQHTGNRWLTEDTRDFIAVFERNGTTS